MLQPFHRITVSGLLRYLPFALLSISAFNGLHAQEGDAAAIVALPDSPEKVLKLSDLCFAYRRTDPDSAALFGHTALELAKKLHFQKGEAQACNDLAILRMDRSDYPGADSLLRHALRIRTELNDSAGMAAIHNKLGNILQEQYRLEEALSEDLLALRIYERTGPPAHEASMLNNIAILQFNLRRLTTALETHRRAAEIRERIGDGPGLAASQGNMANVHVQLGDTAAAIALFTRAIAYFREHGLQQELAVQMNNLAGLNLAQGHWDLAAAQYQEALSIRTLLGDNKAIASSMVGLGGTWLRKKMYSDARRMLMAGLALGRRTGARPEQLQALQDLARLHAMENRADSSFAYQERYAALKDSIFNDDLNTRLAEAEARYENEKKEQQLQAQRADLAGKDLAMAELRATDQRRKFWTVTVSGVAALVVVSALLLLQVQRRRSASARDAAIIQEREAGLRGVLQATEDERRRIAGDLHDGIAQQLTGLKFRLESIAAGRLSGTVVDDDPVREALAIADDAASEVRSIAHALMPKALNDVGLAPALDDMLKRSLAGAGLAHQLDHYGLDQRLPREVETGVYRIAQELAQNTMKHAQAKSVAVQLLKNNGHLVMVYEDDGRGLLDKTGGEGIGLSNIRERAHALRGIFRIEDGAEKGIVATLRIPLPNIA